MTREIPGNGNSIGYWFDLRTQIIRKIRLNFYVILGNTPTILHNIEMDSQGNGKARELNQA